MESLGTQTEFPLDGELAYDAMNTQVNGGFEHEKDDDLKTTSNGDVDIVTSDSKKFVEVMDEVDDDDDNPECGWFGIRPGFIQCCNNPKGYLLFVSLFCVAQGMTVNGLIYVVTTTLERRFNLTSTLSGFISSCYDLTVLVIILFVTYFGEKSHRPKWTGTGTFVFGLGCMLFTLPHYLTDYYEPYSKTIIPTCDVNGTADGECDGEDGDSGLMKYYGVFVAAQVLHGIGASPLYTLNIAFLDDNVKQASLGAYVGVFQAMAILGPALGFAVGGVFLGIYTDLRVDPADVGLTPESPLWIGAWWLPFFIPAGICFLTCIPLLGFPKSLPGTKALRRARTETGHKGSEYKPRSGWQNKLRDFPRAMWNLIKNIPFMCINGAACAETFIIMGISVFGPKYIESQFNVTSGTAALTAGALVIPSALIGCLVSGYIIRVLKLEFRGQVKLCLIVLSISLVGFFAFFIQCPTADFAGVNVQYNNTNITFKGDEYGDDLTAACNKDCNCAARYDPVCGGDILYYNPCFAGCNEMEETDGVKEYSDCSCVESTGGEPSSVEVGKCDFECPGQYAFLVIVFILLCSSFFAIVPQYTTIVRCVDDTQRSFALGINSVLYRLLGSVPAPIAFGSLIDKSCIIWEEDCEGGRICWMYSNREMAMYFFALCVGLKVASLLFCAGALLSFNESYEAQDEVDETKGKGDGELNSDAKVDVDDLQPL